MEQIKEDYVSFEIAKLLKEKGFQAKCTACYHNDSSHTLELISGRINYCNPKFSKYKMIPPYNAPTLQLAMKWLREVHHIFIDIDYDSHEFGDKPYFTLIINMDTCSYYSGKHLPVNRATYEEMAEAAIKYCLENLI